ncbi:hypothetical protein ABK040_003635 [Willaertia magna]
MNATDHSSFLSKILNGTREGFKVIDRNNPSTLYFPSDFALVFFSNLTLKQQLESNHQHIKYVIPQHSYRKLLSTKDLYEEDEETFNPRLTTFHMDDEIEKINDFEEENLHQLHGKLTTHWSIPSSSDSSNHHHRRKLCNHHSHGTDVTEKLNAKALWEEGILGQHVKVAIFDTGLYENHESFENIEDMINYTNEENVNDELGHGTFVSGIIASRHSFESKIENNSTKVIPSNCKGFAPKSSLYIFKVFTSKQVSYTSWFLDAFNYALKSGINILNLSIGGPDYMDLPFIEKVRELTANGIIIVSAIGNDGPLYGTLNNPADLVNVIGVGGVDDNDQIAKFSSRGLTTYELRFPNRYGRVKPDLVTNSVKLKGLSLNRQHHSCSAMLSGTSVASPVVAGAITLLASHSALNNDGNIQHSKINPASVKQVLIESSQKLKGSNIFEQGSGKLDLLKAFELMKGYKPKASFYPNELDFTNCPYMWPFCSQPLYYTHQPVTVNVTILNGMHSTGHISSKPQFIPGKNGEVLDVTFSYPQMIWPYSGWLGVHIQINSGARFYTGYAEGKIKLTITSPPSIESDDLELQTSEIELSLKVKIIPTPLKQQRILWDQYHNIQYPPGYVPRDNLNNKDEILDWNGDHIHTNFREMYNYLRNKGYYIEILTNDLTSFDGSKYGTLMIVDSEEEFTEEEREKLKEDIHTYGLSLAVFADWYSVPIMKHIKFFDDNTYTVWTPITGGSNLPALNALLDPYNIAFGTRIYDGEIQIGNSKATFASGTSIIKFPEDGMLASFILRDQGIELLGGLKNQQRQSSNQQKVPILGFLHYGKGRISVFGDSNCIDDVGNVPHKCFWLLDQILLFTSQNKLSDKFKEESNLKTLSNLFISQNSLLPERMIGSELHLHSKVSLDKLIDARPLNGSNKYVGRTVRGSNNLYNDYEEALSQYETGSFSPLITNLHLRVILPIFFMFVVLVFLIYLSISHKRKMNTVVFSEKRHTV